jgi:hypothetical protein
MAQDIVQTIDGKDVQVLPIDSVEYVSVSDACKISDFSRAYINKLLNGDKLVGMNLAGLGWLVSIESLKAFEATDRRQPGKARLINQALEEFLTAHDLLDSWARVRDDVVAAYDLSKAEAANDAAAEDSTDEADEEEAAE